MRVWLAILLLLVALPAQAQQGQGLSTATVVASCGGQALATGPLTNLTMDTQGYLCLVGIGGGVSAWNATDAAAGNYTISNGGLTITANSTYKMVRGTISHNSGKYYVEYLFNVSGTNAQLGFANTAVGFTTPYAASVWYGTNVISTGFTSNYTTVLFPASGYTWGFAIDFTAGKIWAAANGVWINGSDPAAGTLPIISFVPATVGALFPAVSIGDVGDVTTLKATAASQTYAAPAGFTAWDGP
jgi:hypothetical protein